MLWPWTGTAEHWAWYCRRHTIVSAGGPRRPRGQMSSSRMGPSVLLAISQRNMWAERKVMHARRLARLLIRGSAGHTSTRGRDPAVCQECSRNHDLGERNQERADSDRCGMQRREIGLKRHAALAQSWPLSISQAGRVLFISWPGGRASGRERGAIWAEGHTN